MGSVEALQYTVNRRGGQVQGLFIFRFGLRGSRLSRESGNPHHRGLRQPSRGKTVWFPACAGKTRDCMVSRLRGKDERLYGFRPAREGRETVWFPACAGKTRNCMVSRLRGKDESGKDESGKDERLYGFPPARERRETVWFPACAGKTRAGRTRAGRTRK